jgi:hypothetical protein
MRTARQARFEMIVTFLAFVTGAWGLRPTPTVLTRSAFATAAEPRERDDTQRAPEDYDFAKLSWEQAKKLNGKQIRTKILIGPVQYRDGKTIVDCSGNTVWFDENPAPKWSGKYVWVVSTFSIMHHEAKMVGSSQIPEGVEFRLIDAKIIKP